jgi:hypothetical protein
MPSGNVTTTDRLKRVLDIKELLDQGKSQNEIAKETGMALTTIQRSIKYLDELSTCDLSASQISAKRAEIYMEALEATEEAKLMFTKYKDEAKPLAARSWFISWLDALRLRMTLYGLDNIKIGAFTQINQQINTVEPEKIDVTAGAKLADMMKKKHEAKLVEKIKSEEI